MADATLTLTIPSAQVNRVLNAFAMQYRWSPGLGVTKQQFAKQQIIAFIFATVKKQEQAARNAEIKAALDSTVYPDPGVT